jgi:hypothetical protein
MSDLDQNNLRLNIDYHISTASTQIHNDLISRMQYYLYCVDNCHPDRPIPQLFIDYENKTFPDEKFMDLVACFFDYPILKMVESGLFWVSSKVDSNEFLDINEGTNIEKMLLKYDIKAENSEIKELRKNFQKTDILTIMIVNPIWCDINFFDPAYLLIDKNMHPSNSFCSCINGFCLCVLIYIIFGILAITGFVFACMGFNNEQAEKVQEWKSMPIVFISFSISEFVVIVTLIILIIKRIKK